jgi:Na+-driven multidrug efflux pump
MWAVRIPLAARLAPVYGLQGVWIAMAVELSVRGVLFIIFLVRKTIKTRKKEAARE